MVEKPNANDLFLAFVFYFPNVQDDIVGDLQLVFDVKIHQIVANGAGNGIADNTLEHSRLIALGNVFLKIESDIVRDFLNVLLLVGARKQHDGYDSRQDNKYSKKPLHFD